MALKNCTTSMWIGFWLDRYSDDKNGDHVIDAEKLKAAVEPLLALDKNGDGELRDEELRPPMGAERERGRACGQGPGGPGGQRGPGGPAQDPAKFVEHAMEFDADQDGKLSAEELLVFAKQMPNHRLGGPAQTGPAQTDRPQRGGGQRGERPQLPGFDN